MLTQLRLTNFKNFQEATLTLGPLTVLVGTNASGKSNLRDALRFLHGVSRGYTLAEIMGIKYGEGGEVQWRGLRGGPREVAYLQSKTFAIEVTMTEAMEEHSPQLEEYHYYIVVMCDSNGNPASIVGEKLRVGNKHIFSTTANQGPGIDHIGLLSVNRPFCPSADSRIRFSSNQPVLTQIATKYPPSEEDSKEYRAITTAMKILGSMRFLDINPEAIRQPSFPGQHVLGDRGENASSVLQAICQNEQGKETLLAWLKELTPMDAVDFEFPPDQIGRVLATLVEGNGQRTSAYSASDGTLRFLAMIAALLGPEPAHFYFFEELDNGIHPTRLHLLLQLIEHKVSEGQIQMVATTHSPPLLRLLSQQSLKTTSLLYRSPESPAARIVPVLDLPEARRAIAEEDVATLFETGWLEDAVAFQETQETQEAVV